MKTHEAGSSGWSRGRMGAIIALVFLSQVLAVVFLNPRAQSALSRRDRPFPVQLVAGRLDGWLQLTEPTIFALARPHGFSGAAWLEETPMSYRAADWTEPLRWRELSVEKLGGTLAGMIATNTPLPRRFEKPPPSLSPPIDEMPSTLPAQSSVRLGGPLAGRALVSPMELPARPFADTLAQTVVRVLVDRRGFTLSATLLEGSGSAEADQLAMAFARQARYEPALPSESGAAPRNGDAFEWGQMVFQWRTLPMANSGGPTAKP